MERPQKSEVIEFRMNISGTAIRMGNSKGPQMGVSRVY